MKDQIDQTQKEFIFWNKEFLEADNIIAHLAAITQIELVSKLNYIDTIVKLGNVSFEDLVSLCYNIVSRVPVPLVKVDVPYVVRCRPNKLGERMFTNISDLSYNPKSRPGRFNLECEPLFYAAPPSKKENGFPPELCAIFETNKEFKDDNCIIDNDRYVTLGYWNINKRFFAIALSFYSQADRNNEAINYMNNFFTNILSRKFSPPSKEIMLYLYKYLSLRAGSIQENENYYYITTAFRHALEHYYGRELKAILYSSSMTENKALNLVITKDIIDSGDVSFGQAIMYRIDRNKHVEHCTEFVSADKNGEFEFKMIS